MKKHTIIPLLLLLMLATEASAQILMRDVFAQLPESILPLMSKNNRLDCIDFIENGMEARVTNHLDDHVVLKVLTEDYLKLEASQASTVEMKLFAQDNDTLICVNRTYRGPAEDSDVRIYTLSWQLVSVIQRPSAAEFLKQAQTGITAQQADTISLIRSEAEALPLVKANLSPQNTELRWTLQSTEFSKEIKKVADKYLRTLPQPLEGLGGLGGR